MNKSTFASLALVIFITACAPPAAWRKDGVSQDATKTVLSECKYQVGINKIPAEKQQDLIVSCMQGKGFRWR